MWEVDVDFLEGGETLRDEKSPLGKAQIMGTKKAVDEYDGDWVCGEDYTEPY